MKIVLTIITSLIFFTSFAQEFGFKKGIISVDKVPVAKLERTLKKTNKSEYVVTSIEGKKLIEMKEFWVGTAAYYHLLFVGDSTKADMLYELLTFTLNMEKSLAMQLVKEYKIFTKEGLNQPAITTMIAGSKSTLESVKASENKKAIIADALAHPKIYVNENGSITFNDKLIGYIEAGDNFRWDFDPIKILDANRNVVGTKLKKTAFELDGYLLMRDGKEIKISKQDWNNNDDKKAKSKKIVEELIAAGYYQ